MIRESLLLIRLQLLRTLNVNELIHGKDNRKSLRAAGMLLLYLVLALILMGYGAAAVGLLCYVGQGGLVPAFLAAVSSLIIFCFTLFEAGPVLFETGDLEMLTALPLHPQAILTGRFFGLYSGAFLLTAGAVVPGGTVYLIMERPGAWAGIFLFAGIPFIPLLPLVLACVTGTAAAALSAGVRFKKAAMTIAGLAAALGIVIWSFSFGFQAEEPGLLELAGLLEDLTVMIGRLYPPAALISAAAAEGNALAFLTFAGLSAGIFILFVSVVQRFFGRITDALKEQAAGRSCRMERLKKGSLLGAVWGRELRRYFSSGVYVVNTMIGYLMTTAAAAALAMAGPESLGRLNEQLQIPGLDNGTLIRHILPFFLALVGSLGNTAPVSVSMEGKQLWQAQCLPISSGVYFGGKILVNLTVAVPAVLLSGAALALGGWMENVFLFLIPLAFSLLGAVMGVWINARLPEFDWKRETDGVKRSPSLMVSMLADWVVITFFCAGAVLAWAAPAVRMAQKSGGSAAAAFGTAIQSGNPAETAGLAARSGVSAALAGEMAVQSQGLVMMAEGIAVAAAAAGSIWLFKSLCRFDLRRLG